ncbi:MAG TPA: LytTR family DNA-binding domain-containing protein [Cytophagales bacterium]|jgi:DNA-binding LytR/AlgR family response regulator
MNCIIVDDEEMSRAIIKHFVEQTQFLNLVGVCPDAITASNVLRDEPVDLLFLDIEMPQMSGMELVRSLTVKPQVIFITSRTDYAVEAFEYQVADYLVKPVTYARFLKAVEKVRDNMDLHTLSQQNPKDIYVKTDAKIVKVNLNDLLYVEALADYVILHTAGGRHIVHSTMKGIEKKLNTGDFARVHRSFIINVEKIEAIEDLSILINKKYIPIGASYKDAFYKRLNVL